MPVRIMFSETHTVSSNKVNEFRIGFVFSGEGQAVLSERLFEQYGIKGTVTRLVSKGCRSSASTD